jgi:hypothetical protein
MSLRKNLLNSILHCFSFSDFGACPFYIEHILLSIFLVECHSIMHTIKRNPLRWFNGFCLFLDGLGIRINSNLVNYKIILVNHHLGSAGSSCISSRDLLSRMSLSVPP